MFVMTVGWVSCMHCNYRLVTFDIIWCTLMIFKVETTFLVSKYLHIRDAFIRVHIHKKGSTILNINHLVSDHSSDLHEYDSQKLAFVGRETLEMSLIPKVWKFYMRLKIMFKNYFFMHLTNITNCHASWIQYKTETIFINKLQEFDNSLHFSWFHLNCRTYIDWIVPIENSWLWNIECRELCHIEWSVCATECHKSWVLVCLAHCRKLD